MSIKEIKSMLLEIKSDVLDIFTGKKFSERHEPFKKRGREKSSLNMCVGFSGFSDEQYEVVAAFLIKMFCLKSSIYFDYVMKVLYPEALALIFSKIKNLTVEEANVLLYGGETEELGIADAVD